MTLMHGGFSEAVFLNQKPLTKNFSQREILRWITKIYVFSWKSFNEHWDFWWLHLRFAACLKKVFHNYTLIKGTMFFLNVKPVFWNVIPVLMKCDTGFLKCVTDKQTNHQTNMRGDALPIAFVVSSESRKLHWKAESKLQTRNPEYVKKTCDEEKRIKV